MSGVTTDLACAACSGHIAAPEFHPHQVCLRTGQPICTTCWDQGVRTSKSIEAPAPDAGKEERTIWRGLARAYESFYIDAFTARIPHLRSIPHPSTGKACLVDPEIFPQESDEQTELDRLLDRQRGLSTDEVRGCPKGRRLALSIPRKKLFGQGPTDLILLAACLVRLERYVEPGYDSQPHSTDELAKEIERWALAPGVAHIIGAFSPTGWAGGSRPEALSTPERQVILVSPAAPVPGDSSALAQEGFAFRAVRPHTLVAETAQIFDPESADSKCARAARYLTSHASIAVPGGMLMLEDERVRLGMEPGLFRSAVEKVTTEDDRLTEEEVDGEWILRHKRA